MTLSRTNYRKYSFTTHEWIKPADGSFIGVQPLPNILSLDLNKQIQTCFVWFGFHLSKSPGWNNSSWRTHKNMEIETNTAHIRYFENAVQIISVLIQHTIHGLCSWSWAFSTLLPVIYRIPLGLSYFNFPAILRGFQSTAKPVSQLVDEDQRIY